MTSSEEIQALKCVLFLTKPELLSPISYFCNIKLRPMLHSQVIADVYHGELFLRARLAGCSVPQRSCHRTSRQAETQTGAQLWTGEAALFTWLDTSWTLPMNLTSVLSPVPRAPFCPACLATSAGVLPHHQLAASFPLPSPSPPHQARRQSMKVRSPLSSSFRPLSGLCKDKWTFQLKGDWAVWQGQVEWDDKGKHTLVCLRGM